MCYVGGPRCSKPALEAFRKAKVRLSKAEKALIDAEIEFENFTDALSQSLLTQIQKEIEAAKAEHTVAEANYNKASEEKRAAYAAYKSAQSDYALTPEGIQRVRDSGDDEKADKLAAHRKKLMDRNSGKPADNHGDTPANSIDPRVSAILAQHVEFENGRVTADTRNAKTQRRLAIKGFLKTATAKEALPLITMTNDPDEVGMVLHHFNRDRQRTAAELSADPALEKKEHVRNRAIVMAAIDNPAIQNVEQLESSVFTGLSSLNPQPLIEDPTIGEAIKKRLDALPDSERSYSRSRWARDNMAVVLDEYATTAKFKPNADKLATTPVVTVPNVADYQRPIHRAPTAEEGNSPMHDLSDVYGDDYLQNPGSYTAFADPEMMRQLRKAAANPDAKVKIYRALPKQFGYVNDGDWVAISRSYAQTHLDNIGDQNNEWHIVSHEVPASTLWSEGNDLAEWGYNGQPLTT